MLRSRAHLSAAPPDRPSEHSAKRVKPAARGADRAVMGNTAVSSPVNRPDDVAAPPAVEPAGNGLYPPRNPGRSTRMIGEVAVDLGFADRLTVEEGVAAARAQGLPTGLVLVDRG